MSNFLSSIDGQVVVGFLTLIVLVVQVCIYRAMHEATLTIERAWISLQSLHVQASSTSTRWVVVGFKNSGKTTARIVAANITIRGSEVVDDEFRSIEDIPATPTYDDDEVIPPSIMVAGEESFINFRVPSRDEQFNLGVLKTGEDRNVWIYGSIHYTDGLSKRVRQYGWARRYDPIKSEREPKDIRFAHVNKPGYNYAD